jgi:hypothetical protein
MSAGERKVLDIGKSAFNKRIEFLFYGSNFGF